MAQRVGVVVVSSQAFLMIWNAAMGYQAANVFHLVRKAQIGMKLRRLRRIGKIAENVAKPVTIPMRLGGKLAGGLMRPLRTLRRVRGAMEAAETVATTKAAGTSWAAVQKAAGAPTAAAVAAAA
mgnify:CR=1 FL=1